MKKSKLILTLLSIATITTVLGAGFSNDNNKKTEILSRFGGNILSAALALVASEGDRKDNNDDIY